MQLMDLVPDLRPVILAARAYQDDRNSLTRFLPNTNVQAITYRLGRRKRMDQTVPVRAFGSPATPIRRPGVVEVRGELPAITPRVDLTETDLNIEFILAQQLAGQQVDWSTWVNAAAGLVSATVDNTFELMRGQALSTGAVALVAEDGDEHAVDFEVPDDNKIAVATAWSTDPTKVFDDLEAGHGQFLDSSGAPAGVALTTNKVYRIMLNALALKYPQAPVGQNELNAYLANLNLPQVYTYDRVLVTDNGDGTKTKDRVYPEGHLTFLPQGDTIGRTELGVTQESIQQVQNQILTANEAAGLTIVTLGQDDPVARAVKGAAVGLPVIQDNEDIVIMSNLVAA